jgi:hypothetical protein
LTKAFMRGQEAFGQVRARSTWEKHVRRIATLLVLALLPTGTAFAAAGDMSVATFLAKADALRAKGPFALMSSDYKLLKAEGEAAGQAYGARLRQERAAGRPSSCPPRGIRPGSNLVLAHLRSYPVAARPSTTMRTAMADYFIKTYPCPN